MTRTHQPSPATGSAPRVQLDLHDYHVVVTGEVTIVRELLLARIRGFDTAGPQGYMMAEGTVSFCTVDRKGRLRVTLGTAAALITKLPALGVAVERVDHRTKTPVAPDPAFAPEPTDARLVAALRAHPVGVIEVAGLHDLIYTLVLICRLFPTATILIQVATRRRAWQLFRQLRNLLGPEVQLITEHWSASARIIICTHRNLKTPSAFDILILPDGPDCWNLSVRDKLNVAWQGARCIYALVPAGLPLSPREALCLQEAAGPIIHRVKAPPAAVRVL